MKQVDKGSQGEKGERKDKERRNMGRKGNRLHSRREGKRDMEVQVARCHDLSTCVEDCGGLWED